MEQLDDTIGWDHGGPTFVQRVVKRAFDIGLACLGLALTGWLIVLAIIGARVDTGQSGLFRQTRVGLQGRRFDILKVRTMRDAPGVNTVVTTENDPRITGFGRFLRRTKLDELPQLLNILAGHMSFVGPRPDLPQYMDRLAGRDRIVLTVRPGVTGPATLKYRNEERLLGGHTDPVRYNDEVIFPDKIRLNRRYVENYSFVSDLRYLVATLFGGQVDE